LRILHSYKKNFNLILNIKICFMNYCIQIEHLHLHLHSTYRQFFFVQYIYQIDYFRYFIIYFDRSSGWYSLQNCTSLKSKSKKISVLSIQSHQTSIDERFYVICSINEQFIKNKIDSVSITEIVLVFVNYKWSKIQLNKIIKIKAR